MPSPKTQTGEAVMERFFELWELWVLGRDFFTHRRREVEVVSHPDGSYTTTSTATVVHDGTTSKIVYMGSDREAAVSAAEAAQQLKGCLRLVESLPFTRCRLQSDCGEGYTGSRALT